MRLTDSRRCSVSHWAAYRGRVDALRALRSFGGWQTLIDIDADGCTPLHRAARGGSLAAIKFLVDECGVDPRTQACAPARCAVIGEAGLSSVSGNDEEASAALSSFSTSVRRQGAAGAVRLYTAPALGADKDGGLPVTATPAASATAPTFAPLASGPTQTKTALSMALDALNLMTGSAAAQGEFSAPDKRSMIPQQRAVVAQLRVLTTQFDARDASLAGSVAFFLRRTLRLPRVWGRFTAPALVVASACYCTVYWAILSRSTTSALASLALALLLPALALAYVRLYTGSASALDSFGKLGPDPWPSMPPWAVLRQPHADAEVYRRRASEAGAAAATAAAEAAAGAVQEPSLTAAVSAERAALRAAWAPLAADAKVLPPLLATAADPAGGVAARVCMPCGLLLPLRAQHCAETDRCYANFDHFSAWAGAPITGTNVGAFAAALALACAATAFLMASALSLAHRTAVSAGSSGPNIPSAFSLVAALFAGPATALNTVLLACGLILSSSQLFLLQARARANITADERLRMHTLPHFYALRVSPDGTPVPVFANPFDQGSAAANVRAFFGWDASSARDLPSAASLAARDVDALRALATAVETAIGRDLHNVREAVAAARAGGLSVAAPVSAAAGSGELASTAAAGTGKDTDAVGSARSEHASSLSPPQSSPNTAAATAAFLHDLQRRSPSLAGYNLSGVADLDALLAALPALPPPGMALRRCMLVRANLLASRAWEALAVQRPRGGGGGGHGHSHGHSGSQHAHGGGDGSHGHAHGST